MAAETAIDMIAADGLAIAAGPVPADPFAPGGLLAAYPEPAFVAGPGGTVLAANEPMRRHEHVPILARSGELGAAIDAAMLAGAAQRRLLGLPGSKSLELLILPCPEAGGAVVLGRDVNLERALRTALAESRQRYKDLVEVSSDFAWETGPDGRFVFVSPRGALGWRADELVGRYPAEFVVAADGIDPAFPFAVKEPVAGVELWFQSASGAPACLSAASRPLAAPSGQWRGARGLCRDMTEARAREAELARARHRERLLVHVVRTIRKEVDPASMLSATAATALPALGAIGCRVYRLDRDRRLVAIAEAGRPVDADEPDAVLLDAERPLERTEGGTRLLAVATRHAGQANGALCLWRSQATASWDDDDRFLVEEMARQLAIAIHQLADREALHELSSTDPLTGLLNRRSFTDELARRVAALSRRERSGALLYVDLDNFKAVNDRFGHAQGDAALVAVAAILRDCMRSRDLMARLGGDEFAVWMDDIVEAAACAKADELIGAGDRLARFSDPQRPLSLSVGIAMLTSGQPAGIAELMERADGAMYRAKRAGKGRRFVADGATQGGAE